MNDSFIYVSSFHFNLLDVYGKSHPFYGVSVAPNKGITNEVMNTWLNEEIEMFDLWADEVIKKIQLMKSNIS